MGKAIINNLGQMKKQWEAFKNNILTILITIISGLVIWYSTEGKNKKEQDVTDLKVQIAQKADESKVKQWDESLRLELKADLATKADNKDVIAVKELLQTNIQLLTKFISMQESRSKGYPVGHIDTNLIQNLTLK